ncbi:MAG: phenylacetic acid degradation operon negative regulatory protein PaaX [Gammaproteobacteria bacterium]
MSDRLEKATQTLLARFHRQRPVRSGSLLITVLGDSIAPRGGAVTLGSLIRLATPFRLPERLVRTSVGRLSQDGWLSYNREGRQSEYFLTDHGRKRFAEATARIYREATQSWDRNWTLLFLPPGSGLKELREELLWLGFGQVRPGVLAHPSRGVEDTREQLAGLGSKAKVILLSAESEGDEADRALIDAGWDLAELARSYRRFVDTFTPVRESLAAGSAPPSETAFVIRTLLIHEYRKIHLRDPLLPHSLLPADWIGTHAYELCRSLYRAVFVAADQYVSAAAETLAGKLERPSRQTYRRFGGLDDTGTSAD